MAELNARIIPKASGTAGEVPLASDLETAELAVNTADGTLFTKDVGGTVVTISGGGGDVESVNGETGVVSLGIEDMNDFGFAPSPGTYEWPNKDNNGSTSSNRDCSNPGDWAGYILSGGDTYIYLHRDSTSEKLVAGATVTLTLGTGESYTGVIDNNTTSQPSWAIGFISSPEVDLIAEAALGVSLTIDSSVLSTGTVPLVEGDILQWNNFDQKFKPTQLPSGSGAVDSVNGETGVVSLGIQDMDDYEPQYSTAIWVYNKTSDSTPEADGQIFFASNSTRFAFNDANGDDVVNSATASSLFYFSADGGSTWATSGSTSRSDSSYISIIYLDLSQLDPEDWLTDYASLPNGTTILVTQQLPDAGDPLVEGDVLRWDTAVQKFRPVENFNVKAASYSDLVGGQSVDSTTAAVVTGCTNVVTENSIYSNTAGVITISETGVYEIYGCVGATGDTANYRWTAEYDVRVDGSMVARQVGGYIRATSQSNYSDIAINTIVPITAGQTVDFTLKRVSNVTGNATVLANTSRILIKKLS